MLMEDNILSKKSGLMYGYKPNRLSFYLILLDAGRLEMLRNTLYKDMERYRLTEIELKGIEYEEVEGGELESGRK